MPAELMVSDPSLQVQQLQLLQQQQQQRHNHGLVNGYINFNQPNIMYRDMSFYNPAVAGGDYVFNIPPQGEKRELQASEAEVPSTSIEDSKQPAAVGRGRKAGDKAGSSTYATRHQAAESRRRQRINDRYGFSGNAGL